MFKLNTHFTLIQQHFPHIDVAQIKRKKNITVMLWKKDKPVVRDPQLQVVEITNFCLN